MKLATNWRSATRKYTTFCFWDAAFTIPLRWKARSGVVIALATEGDEEIKEAADHVLHVPAAPEELSPILEIVPLQLLAYHIAVRRGCDVDQPRNLAKSVTVE